MSVWKEHTTVNRTVLIQMAPIHAAVILDLLLILTEDLAMVTQPLILYKAYIKIFGLVCRHSRV